MTKEEKKQPIKATSKIVQVRKLIRLVVIVGIFVFMVLGIGSGSLCSIGYEAIAFICPLGSLESLFGSAAVIPRVVIVLMVVTALALVFGKAFCSWICPVPPISRFLTSKKKVEKDKTESQEAGRRVLERWDGCNSCASTCSVKASCSAAPGVQKTKRLPGLDSRHLVLGGALVSAAICGFPVFCLVCPVGLTFATGIALYRLVGFNEPTLDLLIFPLVLVLELTLLRKWCHRFCPLSALFSLVAGFGKATRPKVNKSLCARYAGKGCNACAVACPEHIDPCADKGDRALAECTRCGACVQACPQQALRFTKARKGNESVQIEH